MNPTSEAEGGRVDAPISQRERETIDALSAIHANSAAISDSYAALVRKVKSLASQWERDASTIGTHGGRTAGGQGSRRHDCPCTPAGGFLFSEVATCVYLRSSSLPRC